MSRALWAARHFGVVAAVLVSSLLLTRLYGDLTWDPVGAAGDNGWGFFQCSPPTDSPAVSNRAGIAATVRRGACASDPLMLLSAGSFFVFLQHSGEPKGSRTLVFRYQTTTSGWDYPPKLTWVDEFTLRIAVARGCIKQVTKQQSSAHGVNIEYALASEQKPPAIAFWQRPF
jgi:hypothetical protein